MDKSIGKAGGRPVTQEFTRQIQRDNLANNKERDQKYEYYKQRTKYTHDWVHNPNSLTKMFQGQQGVVIAEKPVRGVYQKNSTSEPFVI